MYLFVCFFCFFFCFIFLSFLFFCFYTHVHYSCIDRKREEERGTRGTRRREGGRERDRKRHRKTERDISNVVRRPYLLLRLLPILYFYINIRHIYYIPSRYCIFSFLLFYSSSFLFSLVYETYNQVKIQFFPLPTTLQDRTEPKVFLHSFRYETTS